MSRPCGWQWAELLQSLLLLFGPSLCCPFINLSFFVIFVSEYPEWPRGNPISLLMVWGVAVPQYPPPPSILCSLLFLPVSWCFEVYSMLCSSTTDLPGWCSHMCHTRLLHLISVGWPGPSVHCTLCLFHMRYSICHGSCRLGHLSLVS